MSIDNCKRTGVVFEQVIATCELVNCGGMQVQCLGRVPTMSVDKCDGVQVFVNSDVAAGDFQVRRRTRLVVGWASLVVYQEGEAP